MIMFNIECFDFQLKSCEISMILLPFFFQRNLRFVFFSIVKFRKLHKTIQKIPQNRIKFSKKLDVKIPVEIPVIFMILTGTGIPAKRLILTGTGILPGSRTVYTNTP